MSDNPLEKYVEHLRTIAFFLATISVAFFVLQLSGQGIVANQLQKNIDGIRRLWDIEIGSSDISSYELEHEAEKIRNNSIDYYVHKHNGALKDSYFRALEGDDQAFIYFYRIPYIRDTGSGQEVGYTSFSGGSSWGSEIPNPKMDDVINLWNLLKEPSKVFIPTPEHQGFIIKNNRLITTEFSKKTETGGYHVSGNLLSRQSLFEQLSKIEKMDITGLKATKNEYFFTNFNSSSKESRAILLVSLSEDSVNSQWQIADSFQLIIKVAGRFQDSFPAIHELNIKNPGLRLNEFEEMVQATSKYRSEGTLDLFGVIHLQGNELKTIGGIAILIVQLYFLLHFLEFSRQDANELKRIRFPWLALYRSWLNGFFFIISVCFVPILPAIYELYVFGFSGWWLNYCLWSVATSGVIIATYRKVHEKLHTAPA